MAAKAASAEARAAIDRARADAQRLSLGPIELPSKDAMAPADRLILGELATLNRRMAMQEARTQVARVTDPRALLARLQAAEQAGDIVGAIAVEEVLDERLAVPPAGTAQAIAEHRTLTQKYAEHRASRIPEQERELLAEMEATFAPVAAEAASVTQLQVAINSVQQVSVVDEPTPV